MTTYKDSGVDIQAGDSASKAAYEHAVSTFTSRKGKIGSPVLEEDGYAGFLDMGDFYVVQSTDSTGSKIDIAATMGKFDTLGYDLLAMVADDVVCVGAEVIGITNCIDVPAIDPQMINSMMSGLAKACSEQSIVISAGEIAEVPGAVTRAIWSASAVGIVNKDAIVHTELVQEGDAIITLQSGVARSNGFSLIRKILSDKFGENWVNEPWQNGDAWGEVMLTPSIVYHRAVLSVLNKIDVHGIAHITGGGIPSKVRRVLKKSGLGASLTNLYEPHEAIKDLIELGSVPLEEAYRTWNMGNGMLLMVDPDDVDTVIEMFKSQNIHAKQAGVVTKEAGIRIHTYTEEILLAQISIYNV